MVITADREIAIRFPKLRGFFWHGAGRALYFSPTHFVPGFTSPWAGIMHAARDDSATCNLISGLAWATSLVNMRQPEIVASLLPALRRPVLETGAFSSGISSAMMMAYDIDPLNPWIKKFYEYVPEPSNTATLWGVYVRQPCLHALESTYPELKQSGRLEQLFHFRQNRNT
jgi:hypothetical protein